MGNLCESVASENRMGGILSYFLEDIFCDISKFKKLKSESENEIHKLKARIEQLEQLEIDRSKQNPPESSGGKDQDEREASELKNPTRGPYPDLADVHLLENELIDKRYAVPLTILAPASSMATIHQAILAKVETHGVHLADGPSGPCLVTVVNSSRLDSDMNRDLRKARETPNRLLVIMVVKASRDPPKNEPSIESMLSKWPEDAALIVHFVCDMGLRNLHSCPHNDGELDKLVNHFKNYQ